LTSIIDVWIVFIVFLNWENRLLIRLLTIVKYRSIYSCV
jgi:hypothetical protein